MSFEQILEFGKVDNVNPMTTKVSMHSFSACRPFVTDGHFQKFIFEGL